VTGELGKNLITAVLAMVTVKKLEVLPWEG